MINKDNAGLLLIDAGANCIKEDKRERLFNILRKKLGVVEISASAIDEPNLESTLTYENVKLKNCSFKESIKNKENQKNEEGGIEFNSVGANNKVLIKKFYNHGNSYAPGALSKDNSEYYEEKTTIGIFLPKINEKKFNEIKDMLKKEFNDKEFNDFEDTVFYSTFNLPDISEKVQVRLDYKSVNTETMSIEMKCTTETMQVVRKKWQAAWQAQKEKAQQQKSNEKEFEFDAFTTHTTLIISPTHPKEENKNNNVIINRIMNIVQKAIDMISKKSAIDLLNNLITGFKDLKDKVENTVFGSSEPPK